MYIITETMHIKYILHNSIATPSLKPNTLAGFEPGSSFPEAAAMTIAPRFHAMPWQKSFEVVGKSGFVALGPRTDEGKRNVRFFSILVSGGLRVEMSSRSTTGKMGIKVLKHSDSDVGWVKKGQKEKLGERGREREGEGLSLRERG
jgi:hypothetical protein